MGVNLGDRCYRFGFLCLQWADFSGFVRNLKIVQKNQQL